MNHIIKNIEQYKSWLDDNFWLDDVIVESLELLPNNINQIGNPHEIKLKCFMQITGSYRAGENRTIRKYDLIFKGIKEYSLSGKFIKGNCCEGVEDFDEAKDLVFNLFVPGNLLIICENIEILTQLDIEEKVPHWLSDSDFTVDIEGLNLPIPQMWIEYLKNKKLDVVWRYYSGDSKKPHEIPQDDFTGWYLQLRNRININPEGLFFFTCKIKDSGFYFHLSNKDLEITEIFVAIGEIITELNYSKIKIECGNAFLKVDEWLSHINKIKKSV